MVKLYPDTASGELFRLLSLSVQRSRRGVIWDGRATAMQRRHQAAARRAAGLGCSSTLATVSHISVVKIKDRGLEYLIYCIKSTNLNDLQVHLKTVNCLVLQGGL